MIEKLGNQIREPIENTKYIALYIDEHYVIGGNGIRTDTCGQWPGRKEAILQNKETGSLELWVSNNYAERVVEIDGVGFEFVRSLD